MTTISDIIEAILAALAVNHGTYDLSGADQVKEGTYDRPPGSRAFACVLPPEQTAGEELSRGEFYRETHSIVVRVWAPVAATTTPGQAQATRALVTEVKVALDAARNDDATALGECTDFAVRGVTHQPAAADTPADWAYAALTLNTVHLRARGT